MAFAIPIAKPAKRLKMIDEQGKEEFEQKDFMAAAFLSNPNLAPPAKPEDDHQDESIPTPWEALEKFTTARGELDVILDLITFLEEGKTLAIRSFQKQRRIADLAQDNMLKIGRKQSALQEASRRLRHGAEALRVIAARETSFYSDFAKIQKFWRVRLNPGNADTPFAVELNDSSSATNASLAAGVSRPPTAIPLIKDPQGTLRMQLDVPSGNRPTTKGTGQAGVCQFLLRV